MQKLLPVWLLLLILLLGGLFTMVFGWSVKNAVTGKAHGGRFGDAAVAISSFPDMVRSTFSTLKEDPDGSFRVPRANADLSGFHEIKTAPGIPLQGLMLRADPAALARTAGWRIVAGGFVLNGKVTHAALALTPTLEVVKVWTLSEEDIPGQEPKPPLYKFVHGFTVLKDGSVIFSFDVGVSLQRFDKCGKRLWSIGGGFDHTVALDADEKYAWTLRKTPTTDEVVRVATATGEIVRQISMDEIIAANPTIDILAIREGDDNWGNGNPRNRAEKRLHDPWHLNDVEPLPAAFAGRFEGFQPGDLLLSARSLNLVFIVDPNTLKVKWWQSGAWRRQHDPDWQPTGDITVFDNRMSRDYSRIVSISPASHTTKVLFDGRVNDFYSRIRGKHQITAAGNLLITSPQQGRVFEIEPNGQVVLEMFNTKPGSSQFNYPISEAIWFPSSAFDFQKDLSCEIK